MSGRKIKIPKSAGRIAVFDFKQLCEQPLAASDYVELYANINVDSGTSDLANSNGYNNIFGGFGMTSIIILFSLGMVYNLAFKK